jgi:hypothetical protein
MVITLGLLHQREQMEPIGESDQERGLGHAATIAPGTGTPASPVRTPSPVMDPTGVNLGIPWWEIDDAHPEPDAHQVPWAEPVVEVAQPESTMAELEQEHMARESDLLAHISDLESWALSYEERIDGLVSTNTKLHEALRSQELGSGSQDGAIQRQLNAALQH